MKEQQFICRVQRLQLWLQPRCKCMSKICFQ